MAGERWLTTDFRRLPQKKGLGLDQVDELIFKYLKTNS